MNDLLRDFNDCYFSPRKNENLTSGKKVIYDDDDGAMHVWRFMKMFHFSSM